MVEHHLAKVDVAGSNPVSRSILSSLCSSIRRHRQVAKATVCKTVIPSSNLGAASIFSPSGTSDWPAQASPIHLVGPRARAVLDPPIRRKPALCLRVAGMIGSWTTLISVVDALFTAHRASFRTRSANTRGADDSEPRGVSMLPQRVRSTDEPDDVLQHLLS